MVVVNAADDAGGLRLGVVVRAGGVVDRGGLQFRVDGGAAAALAFVGAPAGAGDHLRHAGEVARVDDGVDDVALFGAAVDEDGVDLVEGQFVIDGLDVRPGDLPVEGFGLAGAGGAGGRRVVACRRVGADLVAARRLARRGGARGVVAGVRGPGGAGVAGDVLEGDAVEVDLGAALDVVPAHAGAGAEDVQAVGGDLHGGGRLDVDELGAVQAVALALGGVVGFGLVPLGPGAVRAEGAEERRDVGVALPGQGEHGELLVAAEFLDHAAGRVLFVGQGLGGDRRVLDEDGGRLRQGLDGDHRVDGAAAAALDLVVGRVAAEGDERCGDERRHDGKDEWAPCVGFGADASSVQQDGAPVSRVHDDPPQRGRVGVYAGRAFRAVDRGVTDVQSGTDVTNVTEIFQCCRCD